MLVSINDLHTRPPLRAVAHPGALARAFSRRARPSRPTRTLTGVLAMNCEIHQLSPLRVSPADAADALRAVLHTILFARTLGAVRPREATCASSGARYVTCGDAGVERLVEDRLDALLAWIRKRDDALLLAAPDDPTTHHQLTLGFYERSEGESGGGPARSRGGLAGSFGGGGGGGSRPGSSWFAGGTLDRAFWEQWRVPLAFVPPSRGDATEAERAERRNALCRRTRDAMAEALAMAEARKDHVPPVTSAAVASFPFVIALPGEEREGALGTLKRMMLSASPPNMLA